MGIKRIVEKQEMDAIKAKGDKDTSLVMKVVAALKENPGKAVEVDPEDLKKLRNKIKNMKRYGFGEDVNHLNIIKDEKDDKSVGVYVEWLDKVPEPVQKNTKKNNAGGKGKGKSKAAADPSKNIATLPPTESIKAFGMAGKKDVLNMIKATVENPGLAAMVDAQLKNMGLTKEQYIALIDEELKK
jgi:hypothetical protein